MPENVVTFFNVHQNNDHNTYAYQKIKSNQEGLDTNLFT